MSAATAASASAIARRDLKGNNDILTLTRPEIVGGIHRAYFEAGADIIETNTFNSNAVSQADYAMAALVPELNYRAARLARTVADEFAAASGAPRFVAGALGPTTRMSSLSPDVNDPGHRSVTFDELRATYLESARALVLGGVDLLLIETVIDTLNAKAAIHAALSLFEETGCAVPIAVSGTITDASGRVLSGQTVEAFWNSMRHAQPLFIGLNCALGGAQLRPYVEELAQVADTYVCAYPNAGLPNAFGEYDEAPEQTAEILGEFAEAGLVNVLGGCCGTTPEHIRLVREAIGRRAPRRLAAQPVKCRLAGLEPLNIDDDSLFVNVGERTNVTGSAKFRKLIEAGDYGAALEVARQQVTSGAQAIDVNMDEGMLESESAMTRFLQPGGLRARHRARAGDDRLLEVVGDRGGAEVRAGQADRQLDQPQGGRGSLRGARPRVAPLRRRHGGDGVRRAGSGRYARASLGDLRARLPHSHRAGGVPGRGHHLRSQHLRDRHRHRGAQRLRSRVHRGDAAHQARAAACAGERRGEQRVVLVPRQRAGARGDALGVPVPRDRRRHGHGDRQRRAVGRLRADRAGAARGLRGRGAQPPARCYRAAAGDRGALQGRGRREAARGSRVAQAPYVQAHRVRPRQGHRRLHHRGHRGRAARGGAAAGGHRRPAHGRHERGRRPVRRRQDVPAAGGQERACHEARGGAPGAVHRAEQGRPRAARQRPDRDGDRQGRRARHRQEHRRSGPAMQ